MKWYVEIIDLTPDEETIQWLLMLSPSELTQQEVVVEECNSITYRTRSIFYEIANSEIVDMWWEVATRLLD